MKFLLYLSRQIDRLNELVGSIVIWICLVVVLVSSGNAIIRKVFDSSSNGWLELQWYLFGAMFLLASGYTLLKNEHVRVDVLSSKLSRKHQVWIEIFGVIFFLMPMAILIMVLSWPVFTDSFLQNEQSSNAGGLVRWPAKLLIPVGFALLVVAGLSHLIKCVAYLSGHGPDPIAKQQGQSSEEQLASEILSERTIDSGLNDSAAQDPASAVRDYSTRTTQRHD
jgi:TRAP-type mannitol/chloroaromatic compound transport system permease small subunit